MGGVGNRVVGGEGSDSEFPGLTAVGLVEMWCAMFLLISLAGTG